MYKVKVEKQSSGLAGEMVVSSIEEVTMKTGDGPSVVIERPTVIEVRGNWGQPNPFGIEARGFRGALNYFIIELPGAWERFWGITLEKKIEKARQKCQKWCDKENAEKNANKK